MLNGIHIFNIIVCNHSQAMMQVLTIFLFQAKLKNILDCHNLMLLLAVDNEWEFVFKILMLNLHLTELLNLIRTSSRFL